jgi:DNA modification methylase
MQSTIQKRLKKSSKIGNTKTDTISESEKGKEMVPKLCLPPLVPSSVVVPFIREQSAFKENDMVIENVETSFESIIEVHNQEGLEFLANVASDSVNLVLTDPPYIISRETGMNKHYNAVKRNEEEGGGRAVKTEEEWEIYKAQSGLEDDSKKDLYLQYGTIYGKKYCVQTDYGEWDSEFTMETLERFIAEYYRVLRKGGTLILFFDLWKISSLKEVLEKHKFKQIRMIEWIKTNPQPLNSKTNYLTNCREIALVAVKGSSPTFHSSYDNGIYSFPLQGGKNRFHPTQKSLALFETLIRKHSNEGDWVLDSFLGSGTTALASKHTGRHFKGCEISAEYYEKMMALLNDS